MTESMISTKETDESEIQEETQRYSGRFDYAMRKFVEYLSEEPDSLSEVLSYIYYAHGKASEYRGLQKSWLREVFQCFSYAPAARDLFGSSTSQHLLAKLVPE